MLKALIGFSLRYASLVVIAALLLSGYAAWRLPDMSVDVFPELNAPTVVIMAEAGGLAADEVEQYVTFPIEAAVNGMTGVRRVRSASAIGLSIVWVDLDWGADLYNARQLVAERMAVVREGLPLTLNPSLHRSPPSRARSCLFRFLLHRGNRRHLNCGPLLSLTSGTRSSPSQEWHKL